MFSENVTLPNDRPHFPPCFQQLSTQFLNHNFFFVNSNLNYPREIGRRDGAHGNRALPMCMGVYKRGQLHSIPLALEHKLITNIFHFERKTSYITMRP